MKLLLLTANFPFPPGEQFLELELPILAAHFDAVTVVPVLHARRRGKAAARPVPPNVTVLHGLAPRSAAAAARAGLAHPRGMGRLVRLLAANLDGSRPAALRRATWMAGGLAATAAALESSGLLADHAAFYAYWSDLPAAVLAASRLLYPAPLRGKRCVARAHRVDLYAEFAGLARLPHARLVLAACDAVHPCSHDGAHYLRARYPEHAEKIAARYLGVRSQEVPAFSSRDGVLRVLSCSFMVPIKRLDRLAEAIALLPGRVRWTHLGDGPEREAVQRIAAGFGPGKEYRAPGPLDNATVLRHYAGEPVDVFANVSASEGLPVSIMEAMSFGVPVLATAVGGVPELVTPATGITLPADPPPRAIAEALARAARAPWDREAIQREQRHRFSTANYHAFAESLAERSGGTWHHAG